MTPLGHISLRKSLSTRLKRASVVGRYSIDLNYGDTVNDLEVHESDQNEALEELLKKSPSQICRVSPLYGLEYSTVKLKQYSSKIKQFLANNIKTTTDVKYTAQICIMENLKLEVNHDDALKIVVHGSTEAGDKLLYYGVLFSWGALPPRVPGVCHLPLLLDRGKPGVCLAVRRTLAKLFDCLVTPLTFTQSHLLLFSALLSSFPPAEGAGEVSFVYSVPRTRLATHLDFSMLIDDIHSFWKQCFSGDEGSSMYDEESAQRLYAVFRSHILQHLQLDVAGLTLCRLKFPGLLLSDCGCLKLRDLHSAKVTLRVLAQMATLLKGSIPKLAAEYD